MSTTSKTQPMKKVTKEVVRASKCERCIEALKVGNERCSDCKIPSSRPPKPYKSTYSFISGRK